ncbi:MAG: efflux RND transporter periplasmic adaptor subunit [Planctomycetaceae bacterium]|nr:efflux RND transporter periplasmic adaptor subunit [Planctomycetaceae bacterium]
MPIQRPTFSESWYRVAALSPRLRGTVQVSRQFFRGQMWHVLQDPSSNQFFRLNEPAYMFIGLLDGRRSIADTWKICNEKLGDDAPTQGEVISLLGQLYTSNLLSAQVPPDARGLFNRYHKRVSREMRGYLTNLLFVRIPLLDPNNFLDRWVGAVGPLFGPAGLVILLALLGVAGYLLAGRGSELMSRGAGVLDTDNLPLLYASFIFIKLFHEFGHAFACKKFGLASGGGGEVHAMGVMMLIFTPMPYVDASSAWALRSKLQRIVVGAGGMLVELGVASIAVVVWAMTHSKTPTPLNAIAYNVMFIAGVSTLLFNANPLLRYDGYYIFSDLLEIPNLAGRSTQYLYYLVKRYAWGVKNLQCPAHSRGEKAWFMFYGPASIAYRVVVCVGILTFIADKLFFVGAILAVAAVAAWVLTPVGKFVHYLVSNTELARSRARAVISTLVLAALLAAGLGLIRASDTTRVEGVTEPRDMRVIYPAAEGVLQRIAATPGQKVLQGQTLAVLVNPELQTNLKTQQHSRAALLTQREIARTDNAAEVQVLDAMIEAMDKKIADLRQQISSLTITAPIAGLWVAPDLDRYEGSFLSRDKQIGMVVDLDHLLIRAVAKQDVAAVLVNEEVQNVELRLQGRPDLTVDGRPLHGRIEAIFKAGQANLPSAALGYAAGGSVQTKADDQHGTTAAQMFFELRIVPDLTAAAAAQGLRLLPGQRVVARIDLPAKPLAVQWWHELQQVIQKRFKV